MMSSAERIREIREADLDIDDDLKIDFSKLRPPGDLRLWAFGVAIAILTMGAIGFFKAPVSYETISYSQAWANDRLAERLSIGEGIKITDASSSMAGDVFELSALVTDGQRTMGVTMSGALKVDAVAWVIRIDNPETWASPVSRKTKSSGDAAAEFVPDMDSQIPDDGTGWRIAKGAVGMLEGAARWTAGAIGSAAHGEFMADMQFPSQAKRAVWGMTIIKIPDDDRAVMASASVSDVSMKNGQVVVSVEHWNMNVITVISIVMAVAGAALLAALLYVPHFLTN